MVMEFIPFWQQAAIVSLNIIKRLVFVTQTMFVWGGKIIFQLFRWEHAAITI